MSRIRLSLSLIASLVVLSGCGNVDEPFSQNSATGSNTGVISQRNFSILADVFDPSVIDPITGNFTRTDVSLTVYVGDRNNQPVTDAHTVFFRTEYGLIDPSCITKNGSCSVTWTAIKPPVPGGPGDDNYVTIVAYTTGEEAFTDTNGNGVFDDGDAGFDDIEEPYIDNDLTFGLGANNLGGSFNAGDSIIDVASTNDPSGVNLAHDIADGFFNGNGCKHTSLCGVAKSIIIWEDIPLKINGPVAAAQTFTISGSITGLPPGETMTLQNNFGNDLTVLANSTAYTFAQAFPDGASYSVTVLTQPPSATCTVSNATGTISGANITNADITCQ